MSLNIKNERVHDLVRQLAEQTGQSMTSAIEDAVRRRLAELGGAREAEIARRRAAIDRIVASARLIPRTGRSTEEIMDEMYDEMGLPR
ncbi:type II toxin-antitoxin system VapB family antitoxin [Microbacterium sp. ARD32]|uniref:type II toxin-antitoxin system VapB family antitoxin n=1 Tax=Microbacterium sp. ARD32 TaxID=2962577 RepID=UPI002882062D|nr:type II toxin-antitoxin system VapB family antitoxin [Microbacterium sp. ARD32]MDT0156059.1 type II toxin-antitoxin system VapB family antitoxin [Microbacterium sp. ARD32]